MKVILVTGGRDYFDTIAVMRELEAVAPDAVMHGCAPGADKSAGMWAGVQKVVELRFPADWSKGKRAGPERNSQMLDVLLDLKAAGHECLVLAFPGGRGTADCVGKARERGLPVREVEESA